jgi:hypothetical protein
MPENNLSLFGIALTFLSSLYTFCLGISEAVFVAKYNNYQDQCDNIWAWICAAAVINICVPVLTVCGLTSLSDEHKDKSGVLHLLYIAGFVIAVSSVVTYSNINNGCHDFWTSHAPELWTFVVIHYVMFWVSIGVTCVAICYACVFVCKSVAK